jgi:uncharacterized protein YjbI with pentapeptide repeats
MVCCKSKEYGGWCKEFETFYVDPICRERAEYCLFHAPLEAKWGTDATFNDEIYKLIQSAIEDGKECNLSGTVFPGAIIFQDESWLDSQGRFTFPSMNLTRADFFGVADFREITFSGDVYFNGVNFLDEASFIRTTFQGSTYFKGATFIKDVFFIDAIFEKRVHFTDNTNFCKEAHFGNAIFAGDVDFERVIFLERADFNRASFSGDVSFSDTSFQTVAFMETRFKGGAIFEKGQSEMFNGPACFSRVEAWDKKIFFRKINFAKGSVSFLDSDLTRFRFEHCAWPQLDGLFMDSEDRNAFYDEIETTLDFSGALVPTNRLLERYGMVEELYRQMKQQAKERHNEPEASRWHYREKEMFRKRKLWRRYLGASFFYWAFSGYGERPVRAGWMLFALFLGGALMMNWFGLVPTGGEPIHGVSKIQEFSFSPDWGKVKLVILTIIEHAIFVKAPAFKAETITGAIFLLLWTKLLIPVQTALFAFALRNKFRR